MEERERTSFGSGTSLREEGAKREEAATRDGVCEVRERERELSEAAIVSVCVCVKKIRFF